jgi:hypothetical protein
MPHPQVLTTEESENINDCSIRYLVYRSAELLYPDHRLVEWRFSVACASPIATPGFLCTGAVCTPILAKYCRANIAKSMDAAQKFLSHILYLRVHRSLSHDSPVLARWRNQHYSQCCWFRPSYSNLT